MSDYISRKAAVDALTKVVLRVADTRLCCGWNVLLLPIVRKQNGFGGFRCLIT